MYQDFYHYRSPDDISYMIGISLKSYNSAKSMCSRKSFITAKHGGITAMRKLGGVGWVTIHSCVIHILGKIHIIKVISLYP